MLSASGLFEDWSASFIAAFIVVAFFGLVFGMVTSWKFRRYKEREELYKIRDNVRKVGERILRRKIEEMEKDSQDPKV